MCVGGVVGGSVGGAIGGAMVEDGGVKEVLKGAGYGAGVGLLIGGASAIGTVIARAALLEVGKVAAKETVK
jgi:hypothetical protein